jgi:hypothetical protein
MKFLQILVLMFGLVIFANAQKAILSGTVYDANGAVIPKTRVIATNEMGECFETLANDEGTYSLDLPFNDYSSRKSSNFKITKYEIRVNRENGFDKFVLKDFMFVPSSKGKMNLDIALYAVNPEPCGYSGADCLSAPSVETTKAKSSDKISQRPLGKLPKARNKSKRKNNK